MKINFLPRITLAAALLAFISIAYAGTPDAKRGGGYTASGTYTYDAGNLTVTVLESTFPDCGPTTDEGEVNSDVFAVTFAGRYMIWDNPEVEGQDTWKRVGRGASDSVVGTWRTRLSGVTNTITFNADGTWVDNGKGTCRNQGNGNSQGSNSMYAPTAVSLKTDGENLYIRYTYSDVDAVVQSIESVWDSGPTLEANISGINLQIRIWNDSGYLGTAFFVDEAYMWGSPYRDRVRIGNNYLEGKVLLSELAAAGISLPDALELDYYYYLGNGQGTETMGFSPVTLSSDYQTLSER